MTGSLEILNVGDGDTKLSFDPAKPAEVKRACKVVTDMLAAGYAILVEAGEKDGRPLYQRALSFDPLTAEYIIVGAPDAEEQEQAPQPTAEATAPARPRRGRSTRIAAAQTRAVAVARSAGG